jgi:hypothetical protein
MRDRDEVETIALDLLEMWRNGNHSDFREYVSGLHPLEALYIGLIMVDYMQSTDSELERELFTISVYPD